MPESLNRIALLPATDMPEPSEFIDEPAFAAPPGLLHAAGAVVVEDDGRVWLVSPTNDFGGPEPTFPKGRVDPEASLQATAVREVYEESGLVVRLVAWLADVRRTQTYTRYYLARRIGGCPSGMGWETQAVHLVPLAQLDKVATKKNDEAIIDALRKALAAR
jgi:8-oxo-dGTP pyrophosphatase MutT (NUDIX family)